jgi:hypothetical protein
MKFRKGGTVFVLMLLVAVASAWMFDTNVRYGNVTIKGNLRAGNAGIVGFTAAADPAQTALDGGMSRCGVATICAGNGTSANAGAIFKASQFFANSSGSGLNSGLMVNHSGSNALVGFNSTANAADNRLWDFGNTGTVFSGRALNDAQSVTPHWIDVSRSGAAITSIVFGAGGNSQTLFTTTDQVVGRATTDTLTNKTLTSPTFTTGISQGSGHKHQRFGATCTTAATPFASCTTTYSWTSAFADANYTPVCVGVLVVNNVGSLHIDSFNSSGVTVRVQSLNNAGAAISFTTVNCIADHD